MATATCTPRARDLSQMTSSAIFRDARGQSLQCQQRERFQVTPSTSARACVGCGRNRAASMLPLLLLCYFSKGADHQSCEDQHCFNEHIEGDGPTVFAHACKMRLEGVVSKRKDSAYRSGRSPDWLKMKNADAPAVKRGAEEDWGKENWRRRARTGS